MTPMPPSLEAPDAPLRASLLARAVHACLHAVLPACCLSCGRRPAYEGRLLRGPYLGLCGECRAALQAPAAGGTEACTGCGRPLATEPRPVPERSGPRCARCLARPPAFSRLWTPWLYRPPVDAVILALKFRRLDYLAAHLGQELGRRLPEVVPAELSRAEAVVPVALHWQRRWRRGYDQAGLIARAMAAELGLPFVAALRRRRATPPQSRLPRSERMGNLRRAFRVRRPERIRDRTVLLVDDVTTTGATLRAAAESLLEAGAREVVAVAAARTPDPAE